MFAWRLRSGDNRVEVEESKVTTTEQSVLTSSSVTIRPAYTIAKVVVVPARNTTIQHGINGSTIRVVSFMGSRRQYTYMYLSLVVSYHQYRLGRRRVMCPPRASSKSRAVLSPA
jgi:hypothetical protein